MQTKIASENQEVIIGHDQPVVVIGERINPTGRKKLAEALEHREWAYVQQDATKQVEAGARVLDVNVGVSAAILSNTSSGTISNSGPRPFRIPLTRLTSEFSRTCITR